MGDDQRALVRLDQVIHDQSGVVSRRQVLDCGLDSAYVRRRLRRRAWVAVFDGVYVTHTGPLTWVQRAWCALLHTTPSALSHGSSWMLLTGQGSTAGPIHVAVDARRNLRQVDGIVVHYRSDYDDAVVATVAPPRVRRRTCPRTARSSASGSYRRRSARISRPRLSRMGRSRGTRRAARPRRRRVAHRPAPCSEPRDHIAVTRLGTRPGSPVSFARGNLRDDPLSFRA
ncbi:hypothetical protein SAMN04488550_3516 [Gordonia malaquae]|uniref:hypothetical protein n=1 Tax=Gordonia malaquae TaxID=410332 RepID=UPI00089CB586|nr:hypothetical protein [Gordonia malaquae]SED94174.1 hypothetical protein SAMN04488550_3516 [Gordonia malaquae]